MSQSAISLTVLQSVVLITELCLEKALKEYKLPFFDYHKKQMIIIKDNSFPLSWLQWLLIKNSNQNQTMETKKK